MKRLIRIVAAVSSALMAAALSFGIVSLHGWGGDVETLLVVFGDRVWVSFDAGRPRVFLLMILPALLLWVARSLAPVRRAE